MKYWFVHFSPNYFCLISKSSKIISRREYIFSKITSRREYIFSIFSKFVLNRLLFGLISVFAVLPFAPQNGALKAVSRDLSFVSYHIWATFCHPFGSDSLIFVIFSNSAPNRLLFVILLFLGASNCGNTQLGHIYKFWV